MITEKQLLINLINTHKSLKKAFAAYKRKTGHTISIPWRKCAHLSDKDMCVVALEVLSKHEGGLSHAIECIYEVLTGSPKGKWAVIDNLDLQTCRVCSVCGHLMREGYLVYDGEDYFCSDKCFLERYAKEQMDEMTASADEDDAAAYWTAWEG